MRSVLKRRSKPLMKRQESQTTCVQNLESACDWISFEVPMEVQPEPMETAQIQARTHG